MSGVEDMIAEAEKSLGLGEHNGDNDNYITRWYGLPGEPWCDQAITYWAYKSGNYDAVCFGEKHAYTVEHAQTFKDHGQWRTDIAGIKRGDIVFFDWDGSNRIAAIDHVGIVTSTGAGGVVNTIEGNIDNVCGRRVRGSDTIVGYGRPKYAGAPTPAPAPAPGPKTKYVPFPGAEWFKGEPNSPIVTAMGKRLVAVGCGRYKSGPGPQWTDVDKASYAAWQRKQGYTGDEADGWPGKASWDALRVPR